MSTHINVRFDNIDGTKAPALVELAGFMQSLGLMHRKELPVDEGMLFSFSSEDDRAFWMENTYIALDIIFMDNAYGVVGIVKGIPLSKKELRCGKPSRYVLEVNSGWAENNGVIVGSKLIIGVLNGE